MTESRSRILFVSHSAEWVGPTNSLLLLLKYLRRHHDVAVLLPGQGSFCDALAKEHIPFFSVKSLTKWSIPEIVGLILRERFDLVYGNNTSGVSRNAFIAAKLTGRPFVCHVRGMGWDHSWRDLGFLRFADAVIAVSEACAASISRFITPQRLHVIYNGVEFFTDGVGGDPTRCPAQSESDRADKEILIISVSHICSRKGQEYAVEAMAEIMKKAPTAHLLLVGSLERDEVYVNRIRKMIEEKYLKGYVSILGFREDVLKLLRNADIFLHTAVVDPHPRSVVESMAAGLPTVAFEADGVAETVVDGQTGYLIPTGDVSALAKAILTLVRDQELRTHFGYNARLRAEQNFSAEATARRVGDVIGKTVASTRAPNRAINGSGQ